MLADKALVTLKKYNSNWYLAALLLALLLVYLIDNLILGPVIGGIWGNQLLLILLWVGLIIFVCFLPAARPAGKLRWRKLLRLLAVMCVMMAVLTAILQGFISGFGKSPYDHSWLGILFNISTLGTILVATELTRSWLINRYFRQRLMLGLPLVALVYTFLTIPLSRITGLDNIRQSTEFAGGTFLPTFAENFLATYLAFLGGPLPAIIYQGGLLAFERFSPILPHAPWLLQALLGMVAPVLGMILVHEVYQHESRQAKPQTRQEGGMLGWLLTGVASILIVWFALGVFSVFPRVIITGSMVPVINIGDVVIIKEVPGEQVQLGDVILFPMGQVQVVHRVIEVLEVICNIISDPNMKSAQFFHVVHFCILKTNTVC